MAAAPGLVPSSPSTGVPVHATVGTPSPTRGELVSVATLHGAEGRALLDGWRGLSAQARHPNPFQGPDLLVPALHHLVGEDQVRLLVVPEPGRASGAVGLVMPLESRPRFRRIRWRVTAGWQHTHHFLGTPLVSPGFGVDGWCAALDHLEQHSPDPWLLLSCVDADVASDVEAAAHRDRREVRRVRTYSRAVTRRRPTDDYLERQLSGTRRKELRRVRRRLSEAVGGDLMLVDLVAAGRLKEGMEAFLRLESAGWKGACGGAIDKNPHERAYFLEACGALATHGGVEILALQGRDELPVAMAVNFRDGDTLFNFKITYDERHASYSPGLLLFMEQLSRFHNSGAELLDTCANPGHSMANRLHPDRRELVTLAVGLRAWGGWMVRAAPPLLRAEIHARGLAHSLRRPVPAGRAVRPTTTITRSTTTRTQGRPL